jgi:transcriptional regulator with XRE-family HTH domain
VDRKILHHVVSDQVVSPLLDYLYYNLLMPQKSKLNLPPLNLGSESLGQRLTRFRKERGLTQVQLAAKIGLTQNLVSAYECDRLGIQADMLARFAIALDVSADDLLGLKRSRRPDFSLSLPLLRRLKKIQSLPPFQQKTLLKTIDMFLIAADK